MTITVTGPAVRVTKAVHARGGVTLTGKLGAAVQNSPVTVKLLGRRGKHGALKTIAHVSVPVGRSTFNLATGRLRAGSWAFELEFVAVGVTPSHSALKVVSVK